MMFNSRRNYGIGLLALALLLALAGAGWAQTAPPVSSGTADLYRRAVALLDQAQQELTAGNLSAALTLVKQSNASFTDLQKQVAAVLAERQISPKDAQQLAINQKLAADAQSQGDSLLATAAAKKKEAGELEARGQAEAANAAYGESREQYKQAQNLSIKAAIHALRNQEIIFRFLAP
jgi:hypothetical protein